MRIEAALGAEIGFVERLVWFWSNHFCVSADKIQSMSGAYEREAIRPHVLGRFADLLLAAEGHPAMLFYLDQTVSMGANSIAGINRTPRPQRESRARDSGAAYAGRAHRLYPGRRHRLRQRAHRLDPAAARRQSRARRRIHLQSAPARARRAEGAGKGLRGRNGGAGTRRAARSRRAIPRPQRMSPPSWPATSLPTRRRRRWSSGWRRPSSIPAAISRRSPRRWSRPTKPGRCRRPSSSARASGWSAWCARPGSRRPTPRGSPADRPCSANRCGVRRRPRAFRTTRRPGSTAWGGGSTSPTTSPSAWPAGSIPRTSSRPCSDRQCRREVKQAVGRAESRQQALALLFMSAEFQRR